MGGGPGTSRSSFQARHEEMGRVVTAVRLCDSFRKGTGVLCGDYRSGPERDISLLNGLYDAKLDPCAGWSRSCRAERHAAASMGRVGTSRRRSTWMSLYKDVATPSTARWSPFPSNCTNVLDRAMRICLHTGGRPTACESSPSDVVRSWSTRLPPTDFKDGPPPAWVWSAYAHGAWLPGRSARRADLLNAGEEGSRSSSARARAVPGSRSCNWPTLLGAGVGQGAARQGLSSADDLPYVTRVYRAAWSPVPRTS